MPCSNPDCNSGSPDGFPYQNSSSTVHYANMGWVGYANLKIPGLILGDGQILRVTTADINLSQEITLPDVIDGRIDKTVYQLGPKIVEGSISLPVIADDLSGNSCPDNPKLVAGELLDDLWCWSLSRQEQGRLRYPNATMDIRYANHAAFTFDHCLVNEFTLNVAQSDQLTLDLSIFGRGRSPHINPLENPPISDFLSPARVLTWNDVSITGVGGCASAGQVLFYSNQVRDFSMTVANNADRFYTLGGSLFPIDINVGQREITGNMTLLGLNDTLRQLAETNQNRFTEKNEIRIAVYVGGDTFIEGGVGDFRNRDWIGSSVDGNAIFAKALTSVVFQIEEMSMTNEVFETTVNWFALANDDQNYEAISPCPSGAFPAWV